jgi:hypothetical protein
LAEARLTPGAERNKAEAGKPQAPLPAFVGVLKKYLTVIANCST